MTPLASSSPACPIAATPIAAFSDPFDDACRDPRWRIVARHAAVLEGRGGLRITPAAVPGAYGGYATAEDRGWDLRGQAVMVGVVTAPAAPGTEMQLRVESSIGAEHERYEFTIRSACRLLMRHIVGQVTSEDELPYHASEHRYLRLHFDHQRETITWETSPDGEIWTTRRQLLRAIIVGGALIALRVANESGLVRDTTGTFSGFNTIRTPPRGRYTFGTLLSDPRHADDLYEKGIRQVHLELGWNLYEPQPGHYAFTYVEHIRSEIATWRAGGMRITLGIGLQYAPGWALALPGGRYIDQTGRRANELNLVFSQAVRERAAAYIARIDRDLDLNIFDAIRIGAGGNIELLYPDGGGQNRYWAFDSAAQGGAGRATTLATCPFPGWQPGQRSIGTEQVRLWYDWYLDALADAARWQMDHCRSLGYAGRVELLMPGLGTRPAQLEQEIATYLAGTVERYTTSRGAVWHALVARLHTQPGLVLYCSSAADGSGGDDVTMPDDRSVPLDDPRLEGWSAARWLTYNADRYGLRMNGENPGRTDTNLYGTTMLARALAQMVAGDWEGFYWAHEAELYAPASGISAADYASAIRRYTAP